MPTVTTGYMLMLRGSQPLHGARLAAGTPSLPLLLHIRGLSRAEAAEGFWAALGWKARCLIWAPSPKLHQFKVALRSLSRAVSLFHKGDGKFVQIAVTGPWLVNFRMINHS
jgi:hypothetical protein